MLASHHFYKCESDHTVVIQAQREGSRVKRRKSKRRRTRKLGRCARNRERGGLARVSLEAVVDLTEAAGSRLGPLLSASVATAETSSTARHLLVRLSHGRATETTLVLGERLSTGAGTWTVVSSGKRLNPTLG